MLRPGNLGPLPWILLFKELPSPRGERSVGPREFAHLEHIPLPSKLDYALGIWNPIFPCPNLRPDSNPFSSVGLFPEFIFQCVHSWVVKGDLGTAGEREGSGEKINVQDRISIHMGFLRVPYRAAG